PQLAHHDVQRVSAYPGAEIANAAMRNAIGKAPWRHVGARQWRGGADVSAKRRSFAVARLRKPAVASVSGR
ncbi:hypothetical protein, partial [Accumulibacter sp.]|uniref:hypothetical protein n=1 Tax=Accumulibacter sp. TaxID=2053492 RepID=UPI00258635DB